MNKNLKLKKILLDKNNIKEHFRTGLCNYIYNLLDYKLINLNEYNYLLHIVKKP